MVRKEIEMETKKYTVVIYTENQVGVLTQVANVFSRRSLNIHSLSANASAFEGIHTITIDTVATPKKIEETVKQLEKRVDTVKVFCYSEDEVVYREMALYKVSTNSMISAGNIEAILQVYNARILEINSNFTVISKVGTTDETRRLYDELCKCGLMQFQRSGRAVVSRERQEPLMEYLRKREEMNENR